MGFFSWLFGKKKNNEPLRQYLGIDAEPEVEKQEKKKRAKKKSNTEKPAKNTNEPDIVTTPDVASDAEEIAADIITEPGETEGDSEVKIGGKSGYFDLKKSKDGRYVFNLYAANRVIIAGSRVYSSAQSAMGGINSVIATAEKANIEDQTLKKYTPTPFPKWEIYKDKGGQFRFRLMAQNGTCICRSQGYTTKASCKNGISSIIKTVKDAEVDKSYRKANK